MNAATAASVLGSTAAALVLGVGSAWVARGSATREAEVGVANSGAAAARVALAPFITDDLLAGDPQAERSLDVAMRSFLELADARHLKVWLDDGQVLYSDEPELVGQTFELDTEDAALFGTLRTTSGVSDLRDAENRFDLEAGDEKLLEVYAGARTVEGRPVVVETYFPYSLVERRAAQLRSSFLPLMLTALALLAVVQVPLAISLARRLSKSHQDREHLLERVIAVGDAERRRIAAAVHDGAVQDLVGVSYSIAAAASRAAPPLDADLQAAASSTHKTVRVLRSLLTSIYPIEVPRGGLRAGLDDLVHTLEHDGVHVVFDLAPLRLSPVNELLALRVARESLHNVIAHAGARTVLISLTEVSGRAVLEVSDDGVGFTAEEAEARHNEGHLGLDILADAAADAGASVAIDTEVGRGTSVRLDMVAAS
jgi:signal transduction histidine kinase